MDKRLFRSEHGQDKIINELIYNNMKNQNKSGIFIDIGSYDGIRNSDTYFLEKMRDWSGLLIDPDVTKAQECAHNRWAKVWNLALSDTNSYTDFVKFDNETGIESNLLCNIEQKFLGKHKHEIIKVACATLNEIIANYEFKTIDFLSLDMRGIEKNIFSGYNPSLYPCKIISAKIRPVDKEYMLAWFNKNNYTQVWTNTNGYEFIFMNSNYKFSWNEHEQN